MDIDGMDSDSHPVVGVDELQAALDKFKAANKDNVYYDVAFEKRVAVSAENME